MFLSNFGKSFLELQKSHQQPFNLRYFNIWIRTTIDNIVFVKTINLQIPLKEKNEVFSTIVSEIKNFWIIKYRHSDSLKHSINDGSLQFNLLHLRDS